MTDFTRISTTNVRLEMNERDKQIERLEKEMETLQSRTKTDEV